MDKILELMYKAYLLGIYTSITSHNGEHPYDWDIDNIERDNSFEDFKKVLGR